MIHVVFVDGTEESFEAEDFDYNRKTQMFVIYTANSWMYIPSAFVKYIKFIDE